MALMVLDCHVLSVPLSALFPMALAFGFESLMLWMFDCIVWLTPRVGAEPMVKTEPWQVQGDQFPCDSVKARLFWWIAQSWRRMRRAAEQVM